MSVCSSQTLTFPHPPLQLARQRGDQKRKAQQRIQAAKVSDFVEKVLATDRGPVDLSCCLSLWTLNFDVVPAVIEKQDNKSPLKGKSVF